MTQAEMLALGHKPMSATAAIRAHCLDCCCGSADEVRKCVSVRCPSWPWRMARNPWRAPPTEAQIAARRETGKRLHAKHAGAAPEAINGVDLGAEATPAA
jgi:hypothetical protein